MTQTSVPHTESLVLKAWRFYGDKKRTSENVRTPRLPGATGIYLSEATGCPRKASLRLLKYTASARTQFSRQAMDSGIRGEEKIILVLEAVGWNVERQYPLQTKWGNGKIDALVDARDSAALGDFYLDRPIVVEIKTSTLDQLKNLPWESHTDQCLLYMGLVAYEDYGRPSSKDNPTFESFIPFGEVTYLLKRSHDDNTGVGEKVVSFPVPWNEARFKYLTDKLDLIQDHVKRGIPVPIQLAGEVSKDRPPCQYPNAGKCSFFHHCYGNGNMQTQHTMEF